MANLKTRRMVMAALLAALTTAATMVIRIPTPTLGYIHLGDGMVLICGILLGPGLGAAAAPAGIRAVQEFQKSVPDRQTACDESILVILLNTASLQLIPTTAAMLRLQAGSAEPMVILPAVWVSTALSLTAGIIAAKAMARLSPLSAQPHPGTCTRKRCRR